MNKPPAFQFYPSDYLSDANVDMMTLEQQGAYVRLLCHAWKAETPGRLFNDRSTLAQLARMTADQWEQNSGPILRAFRIDPDGFITQKRLLKEWNRLQERRNQTVEAGKASAEARRERPFNDRSTTVQRKANFSSSSSSSSSVAERESADRPSEKEVVEFATGLTCGMAEWKARDWWQEMQGCGWLDHQHRPISDWKAVLRRVKAKWEADGRPAGPPAARVASAPAGGNGSATPVQRKRVIEELISNMPDDPNQEQRAQLRKLRAELTTVSHQIAGL